MKKPLHQIFVCSSSRMIGEPKGGCFRRNSPDLVQYIESELADRDMEDVLVTNTGCMKLCDDGPVMVIYPEGWWYGNLNENVVDVILDALQKGHPAEDHLLS